MDLISVIVPVYKVEDYLYRCVESIVNQSYKNLEIILVDDGSPDKCPQMCDEWIKKDSRIKVIHKDNGGLSDARNAGLDIASGEYISFVDSDDWISKNYIEKLYHSIIANNADISECNVYYAYGEELSAYNNDSAFFYENNKSVMEAYIRDYHIKTVVWNKLYSIDLLSSIRFEKGKLHEDEFFTYLVLSKVDRLAHINEYLYFYRQRSDSIMGQSQSFAIHNLDSIEGCSNRALYVKENYPDLYFYELRNMTNLCIGQYEMLLSSEKKDYYPHAKREIKKYKKLFKWDLNSFSRLTYKEKTKVFFSSISLAMYARFDLLLKKVRNA